MGNCPIHVESHQYGSVANGGWAEDLKPNAKAMPIIRDIYYAPLNGLRYRVGEPCVGKMQLVDNIYIFAHYVLPSRIAPTGGARLICAPGPFVRPIRRTRLGP